MSINNTYVQTETEYARLNLESFYIGLFLSISSTFFIGTSYVLKKIALTRLEKRGIRAGDGGFGYLNDWIWWLGLIFIGLGEGSNFIAYAYAPASLVTPLGGLSVIITAILSKKFLKENLNLIAKIGCITCLSGSTITVLHAPKEQDFTSLDDLKDRFLSLSFILYAFLVLGVSFILSMLPTKVSKNNPIVYLSISGLIGSLSVMACKGVGTAIKESLENGFSLFFENCLYPFLVVFLITAITIQMNYLNKALDLFKATVVTPILYVIFTGSVLIASTILFNEWLLLKTSDWIGNICGITCIIIGIFLICAFKDLDITLTSIKSNGSSFVLPKFTSNLAKETHERKEITSRVRAFRNRLKESESKEKLLHRRSGSMDLMFDG